MMKSNYFQNFTEKDLDKYLIVVKSEFCLDGQIMENDYCLDLKNSEDIDQEGYDKRDFFGDFVLRAIEANSEDEAVDLVSNQYDMDKTMLKAYKLAK